jgi:hypothetical protein
LDPSESLSPFDANIIEKDGAPAIPGKILKISPVGFLFQLVGSTGLKVSSLVTVQFQLPGSNFLVSQPAMVVKTYLRWAEAKPGQGYHVDVKSNVKVQMFEFHFTQLSNDVRSLITKYLEQDTGKE